MTKKNFANAQKIDFSKNKNNNIDIKKSDFVDKDKLISCNINLKSNFYYRKKLRIAKDKYNLDIKDIVHLALDDFFKKNDI